MYLHTALGDATAAQLQDEQSAYRQMTGWAQTLAAAKQRGDPESIIAQMRTAYDTARRRWEAVRSRNQQLDSKVGVRERVGDVQTVVGKGLTVVGGAAKEALEGAGKLPGEAAKGLKWALPVAAGAAVIVLAWLYLPRRKGNG